MKKIRVILLTLLVLIMMTPGLSAYAAVSVWELVGNDGFSGNYASSVSLAFCGGIPYVAYNDTDIGAVVKKFNGTNWEDVGGPVSNYNSAGYTSLAFYDNKPYVAYKDGANSGRVSVKKYDGGVWAYVGSAGFSGTTTSCINLAFSGSTPYVAYIDGSNAAVKYFNGTSWVSVGAGALSSTSAAYLSLAINGGMPYIAYQDKNNSSRATVLKFDTGTGVWSCVGGAAGFTPGTVSYTSMTFIGNILYIAYADGANGSRLSVMKYNGSWSYVGTAGFSSETVGYTSLASDGSAPYIAYTGGLYGYVKKYTGTSWDTVGGSYFAQSMADNSLALNDGTPYVAYENAGILATVKRFQTYYYGSITINGTTGAVYQIKQGSTVVQDGITIPASGSVTISNLLIGNYSVAEKSAPSGYIANKPQEADITADGQTVTVKFVSYQYGSITINGTPGAVYQIKQGSTVVQDDITIPASGSVTISNLLIGNYSVAEKAAPSGYFANKPQEADINTYGQMVTVKFVSYLPVTVTINKTDVTTYGGNDGGIQVTASGGSGTYEYSIGGDWQSGNTFSGLTGGIYQVKARDKAIPDNVSAIASIEITQPGLGGTCLLSNLPGKVLKNSVYQISLPAGYANPVFTTSSSGIATITDRGVVKFINKGVVKITAKATCNGKKCTISKKVTVLVPVESITISYTDLSITKGKFTANIAPLDASNMKITWESSNPKIASVAKTGIITAKSFGTVTITAKAQDGSGVVGVITMNIVHSIQH